MFGLFKKDCAAITSLQYELIAIAAGVAALAVADSLRNQSSKWGKGELKPLFRETLAFSICLAQMRMQRRFKVKSDADVLSIVKELVRQLRSLPVRESAEGGDAMVLTQEILRNATDGEFIEHVTNYARRNYHALDITDHALEVFCTITGQAPNIVKGAGWTMALLMFQMRIGPMLFEKLELDEPMAVVLATARDGCKLIMDKVDNVVWR